MKITEKDSKQSEAKSKSKVDGMISLPKLQKEIKLKLVISMTKKT